MAKAVLSNKRKVGVRAVPVTGYTTSLPPTISSVNYDQGQIEGGGASIVITGTNFTGATAVTFLGTVSAYVVDSPTQITATLPAHAAGSGNIQVTTPGGSATIAFEYWTPASITTNLHLKAVSNTGYTVGGGNGTWLDVSGNGRHASDASLAPNAGAAIQGHTPPDSNGLSGGSRHSLNGFSGTTLDTYINGNRSFCWVMHKADTYTSALTSYDVSAFLEDIGGYYALGVADAGAGNGAPVFYQWDTGSKEIVSTKTIPTGTWFLMVCWYDGTNLNMIVNGVTQTPVAVGSVNVLGLGSTMVFLHNYAAGGEGPDGVTTEIGMTDQSYGATEAGKLLKYCRQRYGVALT